MGKWQYLVHPKTRLLWSLKYECIHGYLFGGRNRPKMGKFLHFYVINWKICKPTCAYLMVHGYSRDQSMPLDQESTPFINSCVVHFYWNTLCTFLLKMKKKGVSEYRSGNYFLVSRCCFKFSTLRWDEKFVLVNLTTLVCVETGFW